jgi:hypothetical protein
MSARIIIDLTNDSDVEVDYEYEEIRDNTLRPPPPDTRNPNVYRVERILATKLTAAGRIYLIKWFGYPVAEATWEHERGLNCEDALARFVASSQH